MTITLAMYMASHSTDFKKDFVAEFKLYKSYLKIHSFE